MSITLFDICSISIPVRNIDIEQCGSPSHDRDTVAMRIGQSEPRDVLTALGNAKYGGMDIHGGIGSERVGKTGNNRDNGDRGD